MSEQIIAPKGWNVDNIVAYLRDNGASIDKDNDGQIVVYTGLAEDEAGNLVVMGE